MIEEKVCVMVWRSVYSLVGRDEKVEMHISTHQLNTLKDSLKIVLNYVEQTEKKMEDLKRTHNKSAVCSR